jgi:hypothetical protein
LCFSYPKPFSKDIEAAVEERKEFIISNLNFIFGARFVACCAMKDCKTIKAEKTCELKFAFL